ncbi:MAG TPA: protein-methionine-sulfoxide reductase heme-binding subunit MsrQ [Anaeromyxobacteraceae bacterium]|nr:protein-methionine-sulfoxide reductase heme-binding subunit MsrQ [Anaeromyxobacteraceae bacterium]
MNRAPETGIPARAGVRRLLKPAAFVLCLAPLAKMGVDAFTGGLGANPIEAVLNRLGFWTLTLLALTLVPTPAKDLLGLAWPVRVRRMVGLFAFTYASLHFAFYVGVDKFFDWRTIGVDLTKRPFIMVGFAALLVLAPLAITSTDGWVRRLGYRRWKRLHRLSYAAAALAIVHFLWRVKADHRRPLMFAAAFAVLLAARVPGWVRLARGPTRVASDRTARQPEGT